MTCTMYVRHYNKHQIGQSSAPIWCLLHADVTKYLCTFAWLVFYWQSVQNLSDSDSIWI